MNHSASLRKRKTGFAPAKCKSLFIFMAMSGIFLFSCNGNKDFDHSTVIPYLKANGKYTFVNSEGKQVIDKEFSEVSAFKNGIAVVTDSTGEYYINTSGELLFGQKFQKAKSFKDGVGRIKMNGKWGCIDRTGKIVIQLEWEQIGENSDEMISVKRNGFWGFINPEGTLVIPARFSEVKDFKLGFCEVKEGDKTFYIDKKGKAWKD